MEWLLYHVARTALAVLQALPLKVVAVLGRCGGTLAYCIDARHRKVAINNLTLCFGGEKSASEIRALARENFRRVGENYASAVRTAIMRQEESRRILTVEGCEKIRVGSVGDPPGIVVAIGHFGNFELYGHTGRYLPGFQFATTYRALRQPSLDRLWQRMRELTGTIFFERRTGSTALREAMNHQRLVIGFLADQHAGDKGLRLPFLGHDCSTSTAPAIFALRYACPLHAAICYRVGLGRWRIEVGDEIPTHDGEAKRSVEDITRDVNRALEAAVRRDPANWFWVHKRWKPQGRQVQEAPVPPPTS